MAGTSYDESLMQMYEAQAIAAEKELELQLKNKENEQLREEVKNLRQKIANRIDDPLSSVLILDKKDQNCIILDSIDGKFHNLSLRPPGTVCSIDIATVVGGELVILDGLMQEFYKLKNDGNWQRLTDINERRSNISNSYVTYKNELWVMGGRFYSDPTTAVSLNSVEKYDPLKNKWIQMPPLKTRRDSAAATVINGRIYISGGKSGDQELTSIEVFDFDLQQWRQFCDLPISLSSHLLLSDGNCLITFEEKCTPPSGFTKAGRIFLNGALAVTALVARFAEGVRREIEYYDTQEATPIVVMWKMDLDSPARWMEASGNQKYRMKFGGVALEAGKILIFGGRDSYNYHQLDSVDIFEENSWKSGPKLPQRMADFSYVSKPSYAYSAIPKSLEEWLLKRFKNN